MTALVANARTFVVTGDLIVAGYGFTAEPDFLYLLDRRTGKVLDRLPVASAPEIVKLRGDRLDCGRTTGRSSRGSSAGSTRHGRRHSQRRTAADYFRGKQS